ncbi:hypothetical protein C1I95_28900 [Micromonospora craterilacus]|uniref:Uncharacterized protein n=1 Tax=Micromonospora craterilacus TaxID=1655439 RepID=A0A2W2DC31_9ACTN|nr:hypothetical protein C1I95_28900 [Micromonospora craterilacus]
MIVSPCDGETTGLAVLDIEYLTRRDGFRRAPVRRDRHYRRDRLRAALVGQHTHHWSELRLT